LQSFCLCCSRVAFFFSFLLRCTRISPPMSDTIRLWTRGSNTSLSLIVDVVFVACNRSCAIQTRHDDAWFVLDRWIALRNTFLTESHNDDHFSSAISLMIHGEMWSCVDFTTSPCQSSSAKNVHQLRILFSYFNQTSLKSSV